MARNPIGRLLAIEAGQWAKAQVGEPNELDMGLGLRMKMQLSRGPWARTRPVHENRN